MSNPARQFMPVTDGAVTYHYEFDQGSQDWHRARKGVITASRVKGMLTPTLKAANNDTSRSIIYEVAAERVTDFLPDSYTSYAMERGHRDEMFARDLYSQTYEQVTECGFITNEAHGFKLGFSPDGLVGEEGLIEVKSRNPGLQIKAIMLDLIDGRVPKDDVLQVQAGLLATGRKWCDYIVYSGGLRMAKVRALPDPAIHEAIIAAGVALEEQVQSGLERYTAFAAQFPTTEYIPFDTGEISL